jgi:protein-S-isoprenylcysteine O-methyltransferase Ste14
MNDLTDFQISIIYFILLVLFYALYKIELKDKRNLEPLTDYDKYRSKSSVKSLILIILFAILFVIYILKAIF